MNILPECTSEKTSPTILCLEEIPTLEGDGWIEGDIDPVNILQPAWTRGKPPIIGATIMTKYRKYDVCFGCPHGTWDPHDNGPNDEQMYQ